MSSTSVMRRQGLVLLAVVGLTVLAVLASVAIVFKGGPDALQSVITIVGFVATASTGLLAFAGVKEVDKRSEERAGSINDHVNRAAEQTRNRVNEVVQEAVANKSIVSHDDLPESLGGDKQ